MKKPYAPNERPDGVAVKKRKKTRRSHAGEGEVTEFFVLLFSNFQLDSADSRSGECKFVRLVNYTVRVRVFFFFFI